MWINYVCEFWIFSIKKNIVINYSNHKITIIHYPLNHFEIFCEGEIAFEVIWYMALCLIINVALLHAIDIGKKRWIRPFFRNENYLTKGWNHISGDQDCCHTVQFFRGPMFELQWSLYYERFTQYFCILW
jgi:hypothetical protein